MAILGYISFLSCVGRGVCDRVTYRQRQRETQRIWAHSNMCMRICWQWQWLSKCIWFCSLIIFKDIPSGPESPPFLELLAFALILLFFFSFPVSNTFCSEPLLAAATIDTAQLRISLSVSRVPPVVDSM